MKKKWLGAILILPFNVTVVIPCLIFYFSGEKFIFPNVYFLILSLILFIFGLYMAISTMILFHKIGKGTLAPWAATKHLIVEGPYKYTRNPMITGVLGILAAEALFLSSLYIFYWMILFFIINCIYFKLFEEKQLENNFKEEYFEYRKNTPMWFPKIRIGKK